MNLSISSSVLDSNWQKVRQVKDSDWKPSNRQVILNTAIDLPFHIGLIVDQSMSQSCPQASLCLVQKGPESQKACIDI